MQTTYETDSRLREAAEQIIRGLDEHPWGQITASVYETARLVSLAPWLHGHQERIQFLVERECERGGWGQPGDGYDLVPTLSATEAGLAVLLRGEYAPDLVPAVDRGMSRLVRALGQGATVDLPDTPAIEIVVPALVQTINQHLTRLVEAGPPGLRRWQACQLPIPAGTQAVLIERIRAMLHEGRAVSPKLLHSLEVFAPIPAQASITVSGVGTVGASPAATGAWLAAQPAHLRDAEAVRRLVDVVDQYGPAVPSVTPISIFERAWVFSSLWDLAPAPRHLVERLGASLGPHGTPGGEGLPPDADTTSVVLAVLERHGARPDLDCLMQYQAGDHFHTWPDERTPSITTNAHVLDMLSVRLDRHPGQRVRYGTAHDRLVSWICGQQRPDGSWTDKWHASPLYATAACIQALCRGALEDAAAREAVDLATAWVIGTQHSDGAWGRWAGNREETAYAMEVLAAAALAGRTTGVAWDFALPRGEAYLLTNLDRDDDPHLWHDKDLYAPGAVVRSAVVAALHRSRRLTGSSDAPL